MAVLLVLSFNRHSSFKNLCNPRNPRIIPSLVTAHGRTGLFIVKILPLNKIPRPQPPRWLAIRGVFTSQPRHVIILRFTPALPSYYPGIFYPPPSAYPTRRCLFHPALPIPLSRRYCSSDSPGLCCSLLIRYTNFSLDLTLNKYTLRGCWHLKI